MRIEYRTIEGELIEYTIDHSAFDGSYITVNHINEIAGRYSVATGRVPEAVFIDMVYYAELIRKIANTMYTPIISHSLRNDNIRLRTTVGELLVCPIYNSYIPVFVGSRVEFDDNNINKIFEEVVLKGFDRI